MSNITIKAGKGVLSLRKSNRLVGLRRKGQAARSMAPSYIEKEVLDNLGGFQVVTLNTGDTSLDHTLDQVRMREDVFTGTHVYYAEHGNKPIIPTGEIIITFQPGSSAEERQVVLDEFALATVEVQEPDTFIVQVTDMSPNPLKVSAQLQNLSMIKWAEPDLDALVEEYPFVKPGDDLIDHQWHLRNTGFVVDANWVMRQGADAKIVDAWQKMGNMGDSKVVVAVIDNGFDLSHPDLKDKVVKPYDLWNGSPVISQGDGRFTHGTPCASVVLAASNSNGIVGVAPNARFMPVSGTSYSLRATEQMFNHCIENGADVISCSWGTTDPAFALNSLKEQVITRAARKGRGGKGCVIVFAAGNENSEFLNYYAAHPDVIAVGACTSKDEHARYSNRGPELSVVAPSNGDWPILAARAWWDEGLSWESGPYRYWRDGKSRGNRYKHFGGTSAACPLVAGVCALMISENPELTARQIKEIIQRTADKIGSPSEYDSRGFSRKFGYGRINALKAVNEAIRLREAVAPPPDIETTVSTGQGLFRFDVSRQASRGFGVQIGAFAEYGNVLVQAEKLKRKFGEAILVNINELNGKTVYKVIVGAFSTQKEARSLLKKMKEKKVNGFVKDLSTLK